VLVRAGADSPEVPSRVPSRTRSVDPAVWDATFGLDPDLCLVVRPDQHIAARCPIAETFDSIERILPAAKSP
jgi:hypothetical protein